MKSQPPTNENAFAHTPDQPVRVSLSSLNQWLVCPLSHRLRYVDGIIAPPSPQAFLGRAVRAVLLEYYRQRLRGNVVSAADLGRWLQGHWSTTAARQGIHFTSHQEEQALLRQGFCLVAAYLRHVGPEEPLPFSVASFLQAPLIDPESGEDHGMVLTADIDLVLPGDAGPWLIDLKVNARSPAQLEIFHDIQLAFHSILYRHVTGQTEAGLEVRTLVRTKIPQIQFQRFPTRSINHFRRLVAVATAFRNAIRAGNDSYYRPTWMCTWCDYRDNLCPDWVPQT